MSGTSFFRTSLLAIGMASAGVGCAMAPSTGRGVNKPSMIDSAIEETRTLDCPPGQAVHARAEVYGLLSAPVNGSVTVECRPAPIQPEASHAQNWRYPSRAWSDAVCLPGARAHASASIRDGNPSTTASCDAYPPMEGLMQFLELLKKGRAIPIPAPQSKPPAQPNDKFSI
jgi:hypothetical protein